MYGLLNFPGDSDKIVFDGLNKEDLGKKVQDNDFIKMAKIAR